MNNDYAISSTVSTAKHHAYHAPVTNSSIRHCLESPPTQQQPPAGSVYDDKIQKEKQICVDVSTFMPTIWTSREAEECVTEFVQQCDERSENVCGEVTETTCEVYLYI